jgi:hypothetical protein
MMGEGYKYRVSLGCLLRIETTEFMNFQLCTTTRGNYFHPCSMFLRYPTSRGETHQECWVACGWIGGGWHPNSGGRRVPIVGVEN